MVLMSFWNFLAAFSFLLKFMIAYFEFINFTLAWDVSKFTNAFIVLLAVSLVVLLFIRVS